MIKVPQMKTRAKEKKEVIYWLLNFSKSKWVSQTLKWFSTKKWLKIPTRDDIFTADPALFGI